MSNIRWNCPGCNRNFKVPEDRIPEDMCPDCMQSKVSALLDEDEEEPEQQPEEVPQGRRIINRTLLFTTPTAPGYEILRVFPAVFASRAEGMSVFADLAVAFRNMTGGRSGTLEGSFHNMREQLLDEIKAQAKAVGANSVLSLQVQFGEISGSGANQMVFANASGTPAILKAL